MKRTFKSTVGVTLLEIMLVLAIAAMVIVMSIRYYSQASSNQRITSYADMLTGIMSAGQSWVQGGNTYSSISNANVQVYMPGNTIPVSPWGSTITVTGSANTIVVTLSAAPSATDCTKLTTLLQPNKSISLNSSCTTTTITP